MRDRSTNEARRIGENVRAARRAAGKSLEVAAGLAGRSKGWLSQVENGKRLLERRADIAALADALEVSADFLLGEPAPEIRPNQPKYPLAALEKVLLDASPNEPPDVPARPIEVLRAMVLEGGMALRNSDHEKSIRLLAEVVGELYVHTATGDERNRAEALRLIVVTCGSDGTCALRQVGQSHLAWVCGERAWEAAQLLEDPIWVGAAAFGRAHARSSANKPRGLMLSPSIADYVEPHIGDDRFAAEVYGMVRLTAALACEVQRDHDGAEAHAAEAAALAKRLGERTHAWEVFGPANVGVWRTFLAVEADRAELALTYADEVEPKAIYSKNRRSSLWLERARAQVKLGRDLDALQSLREAERLSAPQVHNNPLIKELVAGLLDRAGGRDLRGLAWRMNLI